MSTRLWRPIEHGRFILMGMERLEQTIEEFYDHCCPGSSPGRKTLDLSAWKEHLRLAKRERSDNVEASNKIG